jgi:hypothetical protein
MDECSANFFKTPFRLKEQYYENLGTTMDRSSIATVFEEKRNFDTPKKVHSLKFNEYLIEAPKKPVAYATKTTYGDEPLSIELFRDENSNYFEEEANEDFEKLRKISGSLFYYKIDNLFILQGFLEWLVTFDDIKEIFISDIVKSFVMGFNERSRLIYKFFVLIYNDFRIKAHFSKLSELS